MEIRRAYLTGNFFDQRRPIMREWADCLTETMGPVIPDPAEPTDLAGLTRSLNQLFANKARQRADYGTSSIP